MTCGVSRLMAEAKGSGWMVIEDDSTGKTHSFSAFAGWLRQKIVDSTAVKSTHQQNIIRKAS